MNWFPWPPHETPRGISGDRLIRALKNAGYEVVRHRGSHVRLRYPGPVPQVLTVPMDNPLKTGTLHGILTEVAEKRGLTLET